MTGLTSRRVRVEQRQGRLVRRAVFACPGPLLHPGAQVLVGDLDVEELAPGHKVALNVMHATFHLAFVLGRARPGRADHEPIVLRHPPVSFTENGVVDQRLEHRRFQVVGHDPPGDAAPTLERAAMQRNPGGGLLIEDQLGVLVAAVAERGDEDVSVAHLPAGRIIQLAHTAKVNLRLFSRRRMHPHKHLWGLGPQLVHEPAHRRITALIVVIVLQVLPNRGHFDALFDPRLHHFAVWLDTRRHAGWLRWLAPRGRQRGIVRQGPLRVQVALRRGPGLILAHRRARQLQVLGDAALALASPQAVKQFS
jgi:hypothetical protein